MGQRFRDKTVVITGASTGIGRAAAARFAGEGARVVLVARGAEPLENAAKEIGGPDRALAVPTDVADFDAARSLLERAEQHFGAIHVLVNNAGFNSRGAVEGREPEELARIVDVNLKAPILLSRLAIPYLRRAGGGAIVNVASIAGMFPLPHEATYSATKSALRAFSFALAEELRNSGISVSTVCPGPVDTGFLTDELDSVPDLVFSQPMVSADDVATPVLDCAYDGRLERVIPRRSGYLATAGSFVPGVFRAIKPLLESQGRAAKARFRRQRGV